jgi:hypothetical protein
MAKFGRYENGQEKPIETYEGDYMRSEASHVRIFKGAQFLGKDDFADLVVTIRLGKAQSVRQIVDDSPDQRQTAKRSKGPIPPPPNQQPGEPFRKI